MPGVYISNRLMDLLSRETAEGSWGWTDVSKGAVVREFLEDRLREIGYSEDEVFGPENERGRDWFGNDGIDCREAA